MDLYIYACAQDTTEEDLASEDMEGENPEDYSIGIRGVVTISKGHQKMMLSVVFTNAIWVEKVGIYEMDELLYMCRYACLHNSVGGMYRQYLSSLDVHTYLSFC